MARESARVLIASAGAEGYARSRALSEAAGLEALGRAADGESALSMLADVSADILLTDMYLPILDGAALAERVCEANLTVHPGVIVIRTGQMPEVLVRRVTDAGGQVIDASGEALRRAAEAVRPENRPCPRAVSRRLSRTLDRLDVPEHPGRRYLEDAILRTYMDRRMADSMTGRLYPMVAAHFGVTARQAESAMRHVIERAWRGGAADAQYALFRGTIDAERGKPTCGEMVTQLADILRLEDDGQWRLQR